MKTLIVEDEKLAAERLKKLIKSIDNSIEIISMTTNIKDTVNFLKDNEVDLIFLDIQLEDGLSFKIFEGVKIDIPVIFTTAFDKYAIEAFKLNSIDYLLKPIDKDALKNSIDKYSRVANKSSNNYEKLLEYINDRKTYTKNFLIQIDKKIKKIKVSSIAYFYALDKAVYSVTKDGKHYLMDNSLDNIENLVDPEQFFRINRKLIISESSINEMYAYSRARIKLELSPPPPKEIEAIVSIDRSPNFKSWITG